MARYGIRGRTLACLAALYFVLCGKELVLAQAKRTGLSEQILQIRQSYDQACRECNYESHTCQKLSIDRKSKLTALVDANDAESLGAEDLIAYATALEELRRHSELADLFRHVSRRRKLTPHENKSFVRALINSNQTREAEVRLGMLKFSSNGDDSYGVFSFGLAEKFFRRGDLAGFRRYALEFLDWQLDQIKQDPLIGKAVAQTLLRLHSRSIDESSLQSHLAPHYESLVEQETELENTFVENDASAFVRLMAIKHARVAFLNYFSDKDIESELISYLVFTVERSEQLEYRVRASELAFCGNRILGTPFPLSKRTSDSIAKIITKNNGKDDRLHSLLQNLKVGIQAKLHEKSLFSNLQNANGFGYDSGGSKLYCYCNPGKDSFRQLTNLTTRIRKFAPNLELKVVFHSNTTDENQMSLARDSIRSRLKGVDVVLAAQMNRALEVAAQIKHPVITIQKGNKIKYASACNSNEQILDLVRRLR